MEDDCYDPYGIFDWADRMGIRDWTAAKAKARFTELMEQAQSNGPQTITVQGRAAVVVVSVKEWKKRSKRARNLADFFANSPLQESGIKVRRTKSRPRKIEL